MKNPVPQNEPIDTDSKSVWTTVTPFSKYLAMVLFVALPFLGGWVGYMYAPQKSVETGKQLEVNKLVTEEKIQTEQSNQRSDSSSSFSHPPAIEEYELKKFVDEEAGISFMYPDVWGEVKISDEKAYVEEPDHEVERAYCEDFPEFAEDPCVKRFYLFTTRDSGVSEIFMTSVTRGFMDERTWTFGRGSFWGDEVEKIAQDYFEDCSVGRVVKDRCLQLENDKGLIFAARWGDLSYPWEEGMYTINRDYKIFRDGAVFQAFMLSPIRLKRDYVDPHLERLFLETVINTFEYID